MPPGKPGCRLDGLTCEPLGFLLRLLLLAFVVAECRYQDFTGASLCPIIFEKCANYLAVLQGIAFAPTKYTALLDVKLI